MYLPRRFSMIMLAIGLSLVVLPACKGKKKQAEEQARLEALAQETAERQKNRLDRILATPVKDMDDLEYRERILQQIKNQNPTDPEVLTLIKQAEAFLAAERDRLREEALAQSQQNQQQQQLDQELAAFNNDLDAIATAGNTDIANRMINTMLQRFAGPATPVLIAIYRSGETVDYDEPTNAEAFLNYLKDQGRNAHSVYQIERNAAGKITLLELDRR